MRKNNYESPTTKVVEVKAVGMMCNSPMTLWLGTEQGVTPAYDGLTYYTSGSMSW